MAPGRVPRHNDRLDGAHRHPAARHVAGAYGGGRVSWTPLRTVYEYDEKRNSWATRAPLRVARGGLAMIALGSHLHAVGGAGDSPSNAHEVYDPASDRWTDAPPMPTGRDHLAAVAFQGRLWAIGGRTSFVGAPDATLA